MVVNSADIAGEFIGNFRATGTITVRSTGRLFGNVQGGGLTVENGAIVVGVMKIGVKEPEPTVVTAPVPAPAPAPAPRNVPLPADQLALVLPARGA